MRGLLKHMFITAGLLGLFAVLGKKLRFFNNFCTCFFYFQV